MVMRSFGRAGNGKDKSTENRQPEFTERSSSIGVATQHPSLYVLSLLKLPLCAVCAMSHTILTE